MRIKLGAAIVISVVVGLSIPFSISAWLTLGQREQALTQNLIADQERLAEILSLGMQEPLWNINPDAGRPLLQSVVGDDRVVRVVVSDNQFNEFLSKTFPERRTGRGITVEKKIYGKEAVIGHVSIEMDRGRLASQIAQDRRVFIWTLGGQLLLSLLLIVALLQRRLLAPIKRLLHESEQLAQRQLSKPFRWERKDELGILGASLEHTRQALQALFDEIEAKNRALEQDIELRTAAEKELSLHRNHLEDLVAERTVELRDATDRVAAQNVLLQQEVEVRIQTEAALQKKGLEQQDLIKKLQEAQDQLLQSEKMASIGQLAAGIAHEINNPIGFVNSNMGALKTYMETLFDVIADYEAAVGALPDRPDLSAKIVAIRKHAEVDFLKEDATDLVAESMDGLKRVKDIVQSLKDFSHVGEAEWQEADLHRGIDSTLNIVNNEIKYKASVIRQYGNLPPVKCIASQLNQVFMNLLINAAHAIREFGQITIATGCKNGWVWVNISDTGCGIPPEDMRRIFEPFFTTKPVGSGTGLGLSLSYGIIQKHGGRIAVSSVVGEGTTFTVHLPLNAQQPTGELEFASPALSQ